MRPRPPNAEVGWCLECNRYHVPRCDERVTPTDPTPEQVERVAIVIAAAYCNVPVDVAKAEWGKGPNGRKSRAFEERMRRIARAVLAEGVRR